jgi:hypothetical protein
MVCGRFLLVQHRPGEVDNPLFSSWALNGKESPDHQKSEDGFCIHIFDLHESPRMLDEETQERRLICGRRHTKTR